MADMGTPMSTGFSGGNMSNDDIIRILTQLIEALGGNTSAIRRPHASNRQESAQPRKVELDPRSLSSIEKYLKQLQEHPARSIDSVSHTLERTSKNDPQVELLRELLTMQRRSSDAGSQVEKKLAQDHELARKTSDEQLTTLVKAVKDGQQTIQRLRNEGNLEFAKTIQEILDIRNAELKDYKEKNPQAKTYEEVLLEIFKNDGELQSLINNLVKTNNYITDTIVQLNKSQEIINSITDDYNRRLYNYTSDLAVSRTLYKDTSLSKIERFEIVLSNLVKDIDDAIHSYDEEIERLSDTEKDLLEAQLVQLNERKKQLEEDRKLVNKQTYLSNVWKQAGEELKEAGKKFKDAVGNLAVDTFVNRFVDPMKEGFQKVYESIESTRNEISARLRLNSGDYKALEETIFAKIDEAGLTGSVSSADVNQLMVGLAQSGITDQELIAELAIQSAKVKAGGGQLDFANEETLQNLLSARSQFGTQQEYFNFIEQIVNTSLGTQQTLMDEFGNYMAVANGNMNKIFNEQLNSFISLGKNLDNFNTDFSTAMYTAQSSFQGGISPDALEQIYQEIKNTAISEQSALGKILSVSGYSVTDLKDASKLDAYNAIQDALINAIGADTQAEYLPYILSTYGINMSADDARKFQNIARSGGSLTPRDLEAFTSINDRNAQQISDDIKEGNYLSKTQQVNIAAQNSDIVENGALAAEQLYEGDQLVMKGFQAVENGIRDVVTAIGNATKDTISAMFGGTQVGSLLGSGKTPMGGKLGEFGQTASDFLTGAKGTTAGKLGNVAGYATGGVIAAVGAVDVFKESLNGATEENIDKIAANEGLWTGAGTILGTAVAGPLGAAIGGVVGNTASKILSPATKWIYDKVTNMEDPAQDLLDASSELYDSAVLQMDVANKQLQEIEAREKYDKDQQRLYLAQQGVENAYTMSDAELEKAYQAQLNKEKQIAEGTYNEAANAKNISSYMSANAQNVNSLLQDIYSYNAMGYDLPGGTQNFITSRLGGAEKASGLLRVLEETGDLSTAFDAMGIEDSQTRSMLRDYYSLYLKNKESYNARQKEFESKWDEAKRVSTDPNSLQAILTAYIDNNTQLNGNPPDIQMDGVSILTNEAGYPMLDTDGGTYANVGKLKFRTGLTNVPYDNYPALLHTGERILTKEEAKAYNKFSSLAVESLANEYSTVSGDNISSNVFNTAQYGMSDVKTAITSQTNTVESLLNQILQAISTLAGSMRNYNSFGNASSNVIRGNSNVMQLNTM